MNSEEVEQGKKLAAEHWNWLKGVLDLIPGGITNIELIGRLYQDSFIHGFKHGVSISEANKCFIGKPGYNGPPQTWRHDHWVRCLRSLWGIVFAVIGLQLIVWSVA